MKKIIISAILTLLILSPGISSAQDVFYSNEQKFTFQNSDFSVVGWSGDRLYTYRASKEGYYLDAYNDSMRLTATVALDFFPQKIYETKFFATDDNIIVLYQAVQHNQVVQYAAKLDSKARMLQKPLAIDSVKMGWLSSDKQYYSSVISSDKSKLMVYSVGKRKGGKAEFNTILLDNSLNVIARGNPYIESNDDITLSQSLLGNDGTLYLSSSSDGTAKNFSSNAWLFKLLPDGQHFTSTELPLDNNYISGMYIRMDDVKSEVYIGAFYATKKSGNLEGVIYGLYAPAENAFTTFKTIRFDDQLRMAADDRSRKKAFNDFTVHDLIVKNDGGFILVAENYYLSVRTSSYANSFGYYSWYNNGYPATSTREYHYGDIMVIDYDESGTRKWHNFIRKEQYSQEDDGLFSSYAMLNSGASLVFLYNDFTTNKSTLNLAAIDVDGSLQMKKMNQGHSIGADWLPRMGKQIDLRELMIPVLRKNSLGFARIVF